MAAFTDVSIFVSICRYWEGADVCTMLEDIDFMCEVLRILMEACTDNGKNSLNLLIFLCPQLSHCTGQYDNYYYLRHM